MKTVMPSTMKRSHRRWRSVAVVILFTMVVTFIALSQEASLWHSAWLTGYVLLASLFFLAVYNLRKKLPFLPLGSASTWMQLHIYVALCTLPVFVLHVGLRLPNGSFESLLAGLFLTVFGSGLYGLWITRALPKKLTAIGQEVIYERIGQLRFDLADQVRELVVQSAQQSDVLAEFYRRRLAQYFAKPRGPLYFLTPTGYLRRSLQAEVDDLERYLSDDLKPMAHRLSRHIGQKDDLDYQQALQWKLKGWLFVHVGLTYGLLLVSLWHAVMVHAFHGGLP